MTKKNVSNEELKNAGYMTIDEFVDRLSAGVRDYMHTNWRTCDKDDLHHPEDLAANASIYVEIMYRVITDFNR